MQDEEILQHIYRINIDLHNVKEALGETRKKLHELVESIKKGERK